MNDKSIKVALILSATDRMSAVVNGAVGKANARLNAIAKTSFSAGRDMITAGAAAAATLYAPIKAFSDLEDAGLRLKSVMMRDGGIVPVALFEAMNKQTIELGNLLPGTTRDFQNLYATMLEQGTKVNTILSGTGKAAAYGAISLKISYEQAGVLASRLRAQLGVADNDMMKFIDVMSRTKNVGIDAIEMQYAIGRSAGAMKNLGVQGLAASKTLIPLFAMLIREGGGSGETAGTGLAKIMNELLNPNKMAKFHATAKAAGLSFEFFRKGKFLGLENFVAQLTKFQGMDPEKISRILLPLTGGDGMDNQFLTSLSKMGVDGFNEMVKSMASQATLQQKIDLQLTSLKNIWESTVGTFTNTLASFGETFAPSLKIYASLMSSAAIKLQTFIKAHPVLFKWVGLSVMLFSTLAISLGSVAFAFGGIMKTITIISPMFGFLGKVLAFIFNPFRSFSIILGGLSKLLLFGVGVINKVALAFMYASKVIMIAGRFLMANPIILIITAIAIAGFLIYKYWDKIPGWFKQLWGFVKSIFLATWTWIKYLFLNYTPYGLIFKHWNKVSGLFTILWDGVKSVFLTTWTWIKFLFLNFTPYGLVIKHWSKLTGFFQRIWDSIKSVFLTTWTWIKFLFLNFTPHGLVIKHWSNISNFFKGLWSGIKTMFQATWSWIKAMFLNYTPHGLIFQHWDKITGYFIKLWGNVKSVFVTGFKWFFNLHVQFFNAGKNIITSIWEGMKSVASRPVEAIKNILKRVRDFLPFSPAKVGPLRDIHRIRLIETIAGSIKSTPLLNAMKSVTYDISRFKGSVQPTRNGTAGMILNFSPEIHLSGGATSSDANTISSELRKQFEQMMKDFYNQKERTKF